MEIDAATDINNQVENEDGSVIVQRQTEDTPGVTLKKPDTKIVGGAPTMKNIRGSIIQDFKATIKNPTARKLSAQEAVDAAFNALPKQVKDADAAVRQITGEGLWAENDQKYLGIVQQVLDKSGEVDIT